MNVYEYIVIDIVPEIEEKTSISVVKDDWIWSLVQISYPISMFLTLIYRACSSVVIALRLVPKVLGSNPAFS